MRVPIAAVLPIALSCMAALPAAAQNELPDANQFLLTSKQVQITYTTMGNDAARAQLIYSDATTRLRFAGPDLTTQATPAGTLVTATVRRTADTGASLFTVLIPAVKTAPQQPVRIQTFGFQTITSRGGAMSSLQRGQLDHYSIIQFTGTAIAPF